MTWVVACSVLKLLNKWQSHHCAAGCYVSNIFQMTIGTFEWQPRAWSHLCMIMSLYYSVDSSSPFDMQMFWSEAFRSLKLLHYRGGIWGMSSSCGFWIQQKRVIRGCCGRVRKLVWMASLQRSQLSSWMEESGEGLWFCSDSSGLKSLGWHWATAAVFIIDFTGTVRN